jgi:lipopolysaccharide assembly outer membrane protein LptD (OstA)
MTFFFKLSTGKCICVVCCAFFLCISSVSIGQVKKKEAVKGKDTAQKKAKDSFPVAVSPSALGSEVKYKAKDSIIFDVAHKQVFLYGIDNKDKKNGKSHIDYTDIKLDAAYIVIDYNTNTIFARGMPDSSGKIAGKPVFTQGKDIINSDSMAYNFKTKKGKVYTLLTSEGEGFVHVGEAKMLKPDGKDVIYARNAKYTTCNLPEDPHFYIASNKMKLMPGDKVVTGPAWIVIEGVPMPIILPFGFFPANSRKTSGIILPSYGESPTQGFTLKGGGFYWGGNDHFDLALLGDIYTLGGYRIEARTRYKNLYHYGGDFDFSYARNQIGLAETPQFSVQDNFNIHWNHYQDSKAHPGSSFSASVNAATPSFFKANDYTNLAALTNQTMMSSINYTKQFTGTPFNLSVSLTNNQNFATKKIDFGLPNATLSMSRIYPFKNTSAVKKHWYDEIGLNYTANLINNLSAYDSTFQKDILDPAKYRNGLDQEIPISASFKVMKYFTLNPSISNSIYIYTKKFEDQFSTYYDPITARNRDTLISNMYSGLYWAHTHSANVSLSTTIFGMYKFHKGNLLALRHVITPQISAAYSPDYSAKMYGYYGSYTADAYGNVRKYSYYTDGTSVIAAPTLGRTGALNFSLQNNFEMKVKTKNDTANTTKKIKILDYLNFNGGYNFLADSLRLSPINISTHTMLFDKLSVNGSAIFDPYYWDMHGKEHRFYDWDVEHKLGEFTSASLNLGTSLNSKSRTSTGHGLQPVRNPFVYYYYPEPYASFDVPWNLSMGYDATYSALNTELKNGVPVRTPLITHSGRINADLNLTKNWKIVVSSGYDFTTHQPSITKINIYRDLHCWTMSFEWIPFGTYRAYFFNIHIKASSLQDLKLEKRKEYYDF